VSRDPRLFLSDMRDACTRIRELASGLSDEAFFADRTVRDAVLWNLLVLGEAAKWIPGDVRSAHPAVEWRRIAGFRDVLAHGYFGLDESIVWDVVENKIPLLLQSIENALGQKT